MNPSPLGIGIALALGATGIVALGSAATPGTALHSLAVACPPKKAECDTAPAAPAPKVRAPRAPKAPKAPKAPRAPRAPKPPKVHDNTLVLSGGTAAFPATGVVSFGGETIAYAPAMGVTAVVPGTYVPSQAVSGVVVQTVPAPDSVPAGASVLAFPSPNPIAGGVAGSHEPAAKLKRQKAVAAPNSRVFAYGSGTSIAGSGDEENEAGDVAPDVQVLDLSEMLSGLESLDGLAGLEGLDEEIRAEIEEALANVRDELADSFAALEDEDLEDALADFDESWADALEDLDDVMIDVDESIQDAMDDAHEAMEDAMEEAAEAMEEAECEVVEACEDAVEECDELSFESIEDGEGNVIVLRNGEVIAPIELEEIELPTIAIPRIVIPEIKTPNVVIPEIRIEGKEIKLPRVKIHGKEIDLDERLGAKLRERLSRLETELPKRLGKLRELHTLPHGKVRIAPRASIKRFSAPKVEPTPVPEPSEPGVETRRRRTAPSDDANREMLELLNELKDEVRELRKDVDSLKQQIQTSVVTTPIVYGAR